MEPVDAAEIKPFESTDVDEADVLVAELADTTIIESVMDDFIGATEDVLYELIDTSLKGNAVVTHVQITTTTDAIIQALYDLKQQLLDSLAKHGDEFVEQDTSVVAGVVGTADGLRKQVVDEEGV
jgi:hypothetical protein